MNHVFLYVITCRLEQRAYVCVVKHEKTRKLEDFLWITFEFGGEETMTRGFSAQF